MLLSIYWEGYITLLLVILVPYYVFVLLKYFRRELRGLAGWASVQKQGQNDGGDEETDEDVPGIRAAYVNGVAGDERAVRAMEKGEQAEGRQQERTAGVVEPAEWQPPGEGVRSLWSVAQHLTVEIRDLVGKAAKDGTVKEELMMGLKVLLDKEPYRVLRETPFRELINNRILFDVANYCSIRLDAGELDGLWVR